MAKQRTKCKTWVQLAKLLGLTSERARWSDDATRRLSKGCDWGFESFLKIARAAGMSDLDAAKVWCREQLPDQYEKLKARVVTIRNTQFRKEDYRKEAKREAELDALLEESLAHLGDEEEAAREEEDLPPPH
jgi:hypothetical protein